MIDSCTLCMIKRELRINFNVVKGMCCLSFYIWHFLWWYLLQYISKNVCLLCKIVWESDDFLPLLLVQREKKGKCMQSLKTYVKLTKFLFLAWDTYLKASTYKTTVSHQEQQEVSVRRPLSSSWCVLHGLHRLWQISAKYFIGSGWAVREIVFSPMKCGFSVIVFFCCFLSTSTMNRPRADNSSAMFMSLSVISSKQE